VYVDLDTLATALYVRMDDEMKASPQLNRWRPAVGIPPADHRRRVDHGVGDAGPAGLPQREPLGPLCPKVDHSSVSRSAQAARLQASTGTDRQLAYFVAALAADTDLWQHPIRIADSTPVPCGMSRDTVQRSELAGWAGYGYCASHSRLFWGLRLHLVTTVHGLPVAFALTNARQLRHCSDELASQPSMTKTSAPATWP
jgi:hypothetical protein